MQENRPTTYQIDKKYHNLADEGAGTMKYYHTRKRKNGHRTILMFGVAVFIIMLLVLVFAVLEHHSYGQQWIRVFRELFRHAPGKINDHEIK